MCRPTIMSTPSHGKESFGVSGVLFLKGPCFLLDTHQKRFKHCWASITYAVFKCKVMFVTVHIASFLLLIIAWFTIPWKLRDSGKNYWRCVFRSLFLWRVQKLNWGWTSWCTMPFRTRTVIRPCSLVHTHTDNSVWLTLVCSFICMVCVYALVFGVIIANMSIPLETFLRYP